MTKKFNILEQAYQLLEGHSLKLSFLQCLKKPRYKQIETHLFCMNPSKAIKRSERNTIVYSTSILSEKEQNFASTIEQSILSHDFKNCMTLYNKYLSIKNVTS